MSDTDVLQRAAAALRKAHDGQREGSGFTRARILTNVAERRRPRRVRWLLAAPFATLLLVGSAWAQSTGNWARVWQAVATVLPFVEPAPPPAPPRGNSAPPAVERHRPEPRPPEPTVEPAPVVEPVAPEAVTPPSVPPTAAPVAPAPRAREPKAPAVQPARAASARPEPAAPAEPAADPELSAFRSAHELHVQSSPRAAIEAYGGYLRAYPQGRFVPEARYNTALDWIKLGDTAAARAALAPFANGGYGGYRQSEARRLLEALPR